MAFVLSASDAFTAPDLDTLTAHALERHRVEDLHAIVVRRFTHYPLFTTSTYPLEKLCDTLVALALDRSSMRHLAYFVNHVLAGLVPEYPLDLEQLRLLSARYVQPYAGLQSHIFAVDDSTLTNPSHTPRRRPVLFTHAALDSAFQQGPAWAIAASISAIDDTHFLTLVRLTPTVPSDLKNEFSAALSLQIDRPERLNVALDFLDARRLSGLPLALYADPLPPRTLDFLSHLDNTALATLLLPNDCSHPRRVSAAIITAAAASPDLATQLAYRLRAAQPYSYPTWYLDRLFLRVPGLVQLIAAADAPGFEFDALVRLTARLSPLPDFTNELLTTRDTSFYEALRATRILAAD